MINPKTILLVAILSANLTIFGADRSSPVSVTDPMVFIVTERRPLGGHQTGPIAPAGSTIVPASHPAWAGARTVLSQREKDFIMATATRLGGPDLRPDEVATIGILMAGLKDRDPREVIDSKLATATDTYINRH